MNKAIVIILSLGLLFFINCSDQKNKTENKLDNPTEETKIDKNYLTDYAPLADNGDINVVVEIPAGTLEKWEVNKTDGSIKLEYIDEKPRIVQYLPYPGNYGMIPQTLLPKELGGDGDPLDVIVLGDASERGSVIQCKIIGVLKMLDRGEQDDKLIAVKENSPFYSINSIEELDNNYNGVSMIISTWFANYKGAGKIEVLGFEEKLVAEEILQNAIQEYQN